MGKIYDVAVIGAGPSGIAAAVYAAKFGADTVLLEKDSVIGGTAFKAYVNTLNGQSFSLMDGMLSGITKKAWNSMIFDHESLLDRYYELLKTQPVSLLTGHEVISAETGESKITSLLCASPSGKAAISAKIIIDATGMLAIERLAGAYESGAPAYAYMTGLIGKVETVGGKCYSDEAKRLLREKIAWAKENSQLDRNLFIEINPTIRADIAHIAIRYDNAEAVNGRLMRRQINAAAKFLQDFGYGFENASLICSSKEIFYSAQGSFSAKYTLKLSDITENRHFSDQIAALPDLDGAGERVYYIPYCSLLSKSFGNLLLCGRNIGAAANAIDRIDAIPTHFETGKAAGIAAAVAVKNDIEPSEVSSYEIKSKTEDTVSDKIEILSEELGIDYRREDIPPAFEITEPSENDDEGKAFAPAFRQEECADPESFGELDRILSLLGEDVIKQDLNEYAPEIQHAEEKIGLQTDGKEENPSVESLSDEPKSETENLLDELEGYPQAPYADELEAGGESAPEDETGVSENGDGSGPETKEAAEDKAVLSEPVEKEAEEESSGSQEEEYDAKIESSFAALIDEDYEEETAEEETAPAQPQIDEEETSEQPEETVGGEAMPFIKPGAKITSSSDVISLLYDSDISEDAEKAPSPPAPEEKLADDDLSSFYKEEKEQKPAKSSASKDRVDSMLDMIYEITDPSEQPGDMPERQKSQENGPAKKTNAAQSDKFKSIKNFLYDTDKE